MVSSYPNQLSPVPIPEEFGLDSFINAVGDRETSRNDTIVSDTQSVGTAFSRVGAYEKKVNEKFIQK